MLDILTHNLGFPSLYLLQDESCSLQPRKTVTYVSVFFSAVYSFFLTVKSCISFLCKGSNSLL